MKPRIFFKLLPIIVFSILILTSCSLRGCGSRTVSPATSAPATPAVDIPTAILPANTDGAETVYVPGGVYVLGSEETDLAALPHEKPVHKVSLTGFNIYTHEVTNAMYQACVAAGACVSVPSVRSDLADYYSNVNYVKFPAVGVDWNMADAYCKWAGGRLPTEAEWEAAARSGDERIYPWGNDDATCTNAGIKGCKTDNLPFQVGSFALGNSPFKAWDMAGNAWEWVNDWYDANTYASVALTNPLGPWSGDYKVVRGGSYNSSSNNVRGANRFGVEPMLSYPDLGFRCIANGLPVADTINHPDDTHGRREGCDRRVGDTLCLERLDNPRSWQWGTILASCDSARTGYLVVAVANNFGGTYTATLNGTALTCSYHPEANALGCHWPLGPTSTGPYDYVITLSDARGAPVPGATLTGSIPPSTFDTCTDTTGPRLLFNGAAYCGTDNNPYLVIQSTIPIVFTGLTGDVTVADAARECPTHRSNLLVCPIATGLMGSTINERVLGADLTGVTTFDAPLTSSVPVPDCGTGPGNNTPRLRVEAACEAGSSNSGFRVSWEPLAAIQRIRQILVEPGGINWTTCLSEVSGSLFCLSPAPGADGQVHLTVYAQAADSLPPLSPQSFSYTPLACGGNTPTGRDVTFSHLTCRPDGLPGAQAHLHYIDPTGTATARVRYTGADYPCVSGAIPNSFTCNIPIPMPAELQFCFSVGGGVPNCLPNGFNATHVPPRCGGDNTTDRWSVGLSCGTGGNAYQAIINVTGGRNVESVNAVVGGSSLACAAVPASPGSFDCGLPASVLTTPPEFVARFTDGSEARHTFTDFASSLPTECTPGGGRTPGGGLCADNPSVSGWMNLSNQFDVNNDGCVTPLDTLIIIQNLNDAGGPFSLTLPRPAGSPFLDIDGDGIVNAVDVLMTIQYINDRAGETCTPACGPGSPNGGSDWTLEVLCTPSVPEPAGWIELRAHFPGNRTNVDGFGDAFSGCTIIMDPTAGTVSLVCAPGTDLSRPLDYWVHRTDGSSDRHTFTNGAELAATCGGATGGWRATTAACAPEGGLVTFSIYYPDTLSLSDWHVTAPPVTYTCVDHHLSAGSYLACAGPVSSTLGSLAITYTTGGTSATQSFPAWTASTPAYCPTPVPPPGGGNNPPVCSSYSAGLECENAGCYWWAAACHDIPDPCHKYDGDETGCNAASCSWDYKNFTCNTP